MVSTLQLDYYGPRLRKLDISFWTRLGVTNLLTSLVLLFSRFDLVQSTGILSDGGNP